MTLPSLHFNDSQSTPKLPCMRPIQKQSTFKNTESSILTVEGNLEIENQDEVTLEVSVGPEVGQNKGSTSRKKKEMDTKQKNRKETIKQRENYVQDSNPLPPAAMQYQKWKQTPNEIIADYTFHIIDGNWSSSWALKE